MAQKRRFSQILLFFAGISLIAAIDQFFKHKIRQNGGFFVCNKGISFNFPLPHATFWILLIFIIFVIGVCFYLYKKSAVSSHFLLSLVLIGGGTASNGLDRLFFGCVFDYVRFPLKYLPLFNLADVSIFLGTCFLLFALLFKNTSFGCTTCE